MEFIRQFCGSLDGLATPDRYKKWSAISTLATALGRRVYINHKHFRHYPMHYICLVGIPASRKSTAMDKSKELIKEAFPDMPIGASITTREKIVERMSKDTEIRTYVDENGVTREYKPLCFFINEFKNFLSFNPSGMIDFLTDIYGVPVFDSETLKHGLQPIINPCINILACDTPDTIISKMKLALIGGGFSRRLIFVYETEVPDRNTFPDETELAKQSRAWCINHLKKISKVVGPMEWEPDAKEFFDKWNQKIRPSDDPVLQGYFDSKDAIAQKIAMCIAMGEEEPKRLLTKRNLCEAIIMLDENEVNLSKLTVGAGRNELSAYYHKMIDTLKRGSGMLPEAVFHRLAGSNMTEPEYFQSLKFLKDTHQIFESYTDKNVKMIMTPECYNEIKAKGEMKQ